MAVAHDAQTRFPATNGVSGTNSVDTTTGDRTFSHAGSASAAAAVVVLCYSGVVRVVTHVLYGGVEMNLTAVAQDTTEAGRVEVYTLEGGIPTGTQTVTLKGCTATGKWATCSTVTGTLIQVDGVNFVDTATSQNPQVNITNAATAIAYGGSHQGNAAPGTTGITGCTVQHQNDYGTLSANTFRWTSPTAAGTTAVGVASAASDDNCVAAIAFSEFTAPSSAAYRVPGSEVVTRVGSVTDPWSVGGPLHAASGDVVHLTFAYFDVEVGPDSFTGFTAGPTAEEGLNDGRGQMFYGFYDTVGAGPYSIGWPSTAEGIVIATAIRNVDPTTPLSVASTALDDSVAALTWTTTGLTPGQDGACVVGVGACSPNGADRIWRITAGTTPRIFVFSVTGNQMIMQGTINQVTAAAVTTSGTNTISETTYGLQMAFAPTSGTIYEKAGSVIAGTTASGTDAESKEYPKAGLVISGTSSSGADVFEATETGSAISGSRASGADVFEATETGSVIAGSRASGADVFEATETGSVLSGSRASGISEHAVGGTIYEKTGMVISGTRASGADAFEATETGAVQAGSRQSAPDQFTASETAGTIAGTRASGGDVFEATELGSAIAGAQASGASEHVVSGSFTKAGLAASGTRASGADVFEATEAGSAIAGSRASGASAFVGATVYTKSGVAAAGTRVSGADAYISVEIGLAVMGSFMGGDNEAMRSRAGLVAVGTMLSGDALAGVTPGTVAGGVLAGISAAGGPFSRSSASGSVSELIEVG